MTKYPSQAKWRERHPKRVWAQSALRSALKRGLILQEPCMVCGSPIAEAHHPDYDRPMHVHWLCRKHHKAAHRQKGDAA